MHCENPCFDKKIISLSEFYIIIRNFVSKTERITSFKAEQLSGNKFKLLPIRLHIVDVNGGCNKYDKLWQVELLIKLSEERFKTLEYLFKEKYIILSKGQHRINQYIKRNRNP